jgi:hypothetical protein
MSRNRQTGVRARGAGRAGEIGHWDQIEQLVASAIGFSSGRARVSIKQSLASSRVRRVVGQERRFATQQNRAVLADVEYPWASFHKVIGGSLNAQKTLQGSGILRTSSSITGSGSTSPVPG